MPRDLSVVELLSWEDLISLADSRLEEAELLRANGFHAAAIYLGGLAVECWLKAAICKSLDWDKLLGVFKSHDLEGLLKYSGYDRRLRTNPEVLVSFNRLAKRWAGVETNEVPEPGSVRYKPPSSYDERKADEFLKWVSDPKVGVATWLQNNIR